MLQLRRLVSLTGRTAPGRMPDFTAAHLLYVLVYLAENRVGRKRLAEELRVGEGTVRTLLGRLQEEGLVETTRSGISLSPVGVEYLKAVNAAVLWADFPHSGLTVDSINFVVLVRGAADRVRLGVEQRDQALIHGARGATTLVYDGSRWRVPGINEPIPDEVVDHLEIFKPRDRDVAVIGSSGDKFTAALGGFAAALDLI